MTLSSNQMNGELDEASLARLADLIHSRKCALFVGPDISESADGFRGLPTSWQLIDGLLERGRYRGRYRPLAQMTQIFEKERGRPQLIAYLREMLEAPEYKPLPIHQLIAHIPLPVIVNGAWDNLLEQALEQKGVPYQLIRNNTDIPQLDSSIGTLLFKPNGSLSEPDTLIVTEQDQYDVFLHLGRVMERVKGVIESYVLLLIGYTSQQEAIFLRLYNEIRAAQGANRPPAFAIQTSARADDSAAWESRGIEVIIANPSEFLYALARAVAQRQGQELNLPPIASLSTALRLTPAELTTEALVINNAMEQIGVADLIERSDVPLLSDEQVTEIETMRAAYGRLTKGFALEQTSARVWLRQGNIEYVRRNFLQAAEYYQRALTAEPEMAEAHHNLHYVWLALGDLPQATQAYLRAVQLNPSLRVVPEHYEIKSVLGAGGVGVVYLATDVRTQQSVAVKVLQRSLSRNERAITSFKREAELLKNFDHPNIVRLLDFLTYDGNYFIVMEYLPGQTLKQFLDTQTGPMPLPAVQRIFDPMCAGLSYAHSRSIIHRDIKPSNIFLVGDQVKLIDFGLARPAVAAQGATQITASVLSAGTVEYMAPEQLEGKPVDVRSDIYSLASVVYEMLSGRNASQGTYRPLSELLPERNALMDEAIEKARDRAPEQRYATVADFHQALTRAIKMQTAAKDAPLLIRLLAYLLKAAQVTAGWSGLALLGIALLLGLIGPALLPTPSWVAAARIVGYVLLVSVTLGALMYWLSVALGRLTRSPALVMYGRAMGVVLALANCFLMLNNVMVFPDPFTLGTLPPSASLEMMSTFIQTIPWTLLQVAFVSVGGFVAQRLGRSFAQGFFITLAICVVLVIGWGCLPPSDNFSLYIQGA